MTVLFTNSFFLAALTGLGLWLSFPGGGELWPLLPVALVPLLFGIAAGGVWRAALSGLTGGLCHFLPLLYWIVIVLGKYGGLAWFISLQALLLLALYMSLYFAVFGMFAQTILRSFPAAVALWLLPGLWVGLDWLRGVLFTGFPWMDLGYAFYKVPVLIQIADLIGHYGVTYLVVLINTLLFLLVRTRRSLSGSLLLVIPVCCLLGGAGIYAIKRLAEVTEQTGAAAAPRMTVGIVQGNIDQSIKWSPSQQQATVETYLTRTHTLLASSPRPSLVVWPETALPFYPPDNSHMEPLRNLVAGRDFSLLTGAPWYEIVDRKARKVKFYNSALVLAPNGNFTGKYYKSHLVPFGEYVPLKKFLPFLAPLVEAVGDFSAGEVEQPLVWKESRAGILICFESVFPEISRQWVKSGANVLVNLTNDAWYGRSSAPYHSLAMAVLRAVETRRSLVRAANTGLSAFVTPAGEIVACSGLFEQWAAAREVVLSREETIWVRYGFLFAPCCLGFSLCASITALMRQRRRQEGRALA